MAVVSVTEATLLKGNNKLENESPTAQRQFFVVYDTKPSDLDVPAGASFGGTSIPAIGSAYKTGDGRLLKSISVSSIGTTLAYLVTCDYAIPNRGSFDPNPLNRPDTIKGSGTSRTKPYMRDFTTPDPQSVVTSAYQPFEQLPENVCGEWEIVVSGNRASIDLGLWATYLANDGVAVNDSPYTVCGIPVDEGQSILKNIRFAGKTEGSYTYVEVEWVLGIAVTFDQDIDDRGTFQLNTAGDDVVPIYADDGITPVSKPAPLDGTGYYDPGVLSGGPQAYLTFKPQPAKDFTVFGWTP